MNEFWRPLEAATCFLVKRGAVSPEGVKALLNAHAGSIALWTTDMDAVRTITSHEEPLDRLAGLISEDE